MKRGILTIVLVNLIFYFIFSYFPKIVFFITFCIMICLIKELKNNKGEK